jgi:hypothetical protein
MVTLEHMESISYESVRRTLKNEIKPHLKCWCIPPEHNAEFVCCMEDILENSGGWNDRSMEGTKRSTVIPRSRMAEPSYERRGREACPGAPGVLRKPDDRAFRRSSPL